MKKTATLMPLVGILFAVSCSQAVAQQESGKKNAIPYEFEGWKGVQGKTLADSKPDFVGPRKATKGSPNMLVIMLDDAGYSNAGSYGDVIKKEPINLKNH